MSNSITFNDERLNALPLRFGILEIDLALLFNVFVEVLAKIIRQAKEIKFTRTRKEEIKLS